jgi:hypothetical protein
VPRHRLVGPTLSWHSGATRVMVSSHCASSHVSSVSFFFKKFGSSQQLHAKDYQSSQGCSAWLNRQTQTTTTTPPMCHQGGRTMEGRMMSASLRPGAPGSRRRPPDPLLGPCCARIEGALSRSLTLGSATGRQPASIGYLLTFRMQLRKRTELLM